MSVGQRKRFWVAWRRPPGRRVKREWYVSLDGLRWVAWPTLPVEGEVSLIEHKIRYEPAIREVETVGISWLRSEGFVVVPPK